MVDQTVVLLLFYLECNLFRCHLYQNHRQVLMDTLSQHGNMTLNIILNGGLNLPNEANIAIFEAVQRYIQRSKRF